MVVWYTVVEQLGTNGWVFNAAVSKMYIKYDYVNKELRSNGLVVCACYFKFLKIFRWF